MFDQSLEFLFTSRCGLATTVTKFGRRRFRLSRRAAYESKMVPEIYNSGCGFHALCNFIQRSLFVVFAQLVASRQIMWRLGKLFCPSSLALAQQISADIQLFPFYLALPNCTRDVLVMDTFIPINNLSRLLLPSISTGLDEIPFDRIWALIVAISLNTSILQCGWIFLSY